jgi:hypothetical protein
MPISRIYRSIRQRQIIRHKNSEGEQLVHVRHTRQQRTTNHCFIRAQAEPNHPPNPTGKVTEIEWWRQKEKRALGVRFPARALKFGF